MLRITAYADRLIEDLDRSSTGPAPIRDMQRNWIGRSEGAEVDFAIAGDAKAWAERSGRRRVPGVPGADAIRVFTTRPDTLFGATYMVLAPEHPLVDALTTPDRREPSRPTAARSPRGATGSGPR